MALGRASIYQGGPLDRLGKPQGCSGEGRDSGE
jgi:hypothetical protein